MAVPTDRRNTSHSLTVRLPSNFENLTACKSLVKCVYYHWFIVTWLYVVLRGAVWSCSLLLFIFLIVIRLMFFSVFMFVSFLCVYFVFCVFKLFCIFFSPFVYSCLFPNFIKVYRPLRSAGNPIAVNNVISYRIISYHFISYHTGQIHVRPFQ
jgi:hypothetical protein